MQRRGNGGVVIGEINRFEAPARALRPGDMVWRQERHPYAATPTTVRVTEPPRQYGSVWIVRGIVPRIGTAQMLFPADGELLQGARAVYRGAPVGRRIVSALDSRAARSGAAVLPLPPHTYR